MTAWTLIARGPRGTPFSEIGDFESIAEAARKVLEAEGDKNGPCFFGFMSIRQASLRTRNYSRVSNIKVKSVFYLLTRKAH